MIHPTQTLPPRPALPQPPESSPWGSESPTAAFSGCLALTGQLTGGVQTLGPTVAIRTSPTTTLAVPDPLGVPMKQVPEEPHSPTKGQSLNDIHLRPFVRFQISILVCLHGCLKIQAIILYI